MRAAFIAVVCVPLTAFSALHAEEAASANEIIVDADLPVAATVEGVPAQLQLSTGLVDRLTLTTDFVAAHGIKPAAIAGKAKINFWGRKEIEGRNRPLGYSIAGKPEKGRAFWFIGDVPQPKFDGSIGPWAIPFDRVRVRITPEVGKEALYGFPYFGDLNNGSVTSYREATFGTAITLAVERELRYPLASAATGAAIAAAYDGTLSGDVWQEPIAFGVTRPVRLLTLKRPFVVGPFSFTQLAVRIRSTRDAAGSGAAIAEAESEANADPSEIVVEAQGKKARKPAFTLAIGRTALNQCATITFEKAARKILLNCRPGK
jgi:hypothetical protein